MAQDVDGGAPNFALPFKDPDPHGEAALVLVETLIHALIAKGSLTTLDAIEIIVDATEVQAEIDVDRGLISDRKQQAAALLRSLSLSLSHDLPKS